jgi:taurine dioxygenase
MSELWIQPTGGALAADVHGVDLSQPVSDAAFGRIAEAWAEHLVLRFSGQKLDDPWMKLCPSRQLDRAHAAANFRPGRSRRRRSRGDRQRKGKGMGGWQL